MKTLPGSTHVRATQEPCPDYLLRVKPRGFNRDRKRPAFQCPAKYLRRIFKGGGKPCLSVHSILLLVVALFKLLDPPRCIHQLLLAGIEGMAIGTDIYGPAVDSGTSLVGSAAGTGKGRFLVFGVKIFFHPYDSLFLFNVISGKERELLTQKTAFGKPEPDYNAGIQDLGPGSAGA